MKEISVKELKDALKLSGFKVFKGAMRYLDPSVKSKYCDLIIKIASLEDDYKIMLVKQNQVIIDNINKEGKHTISWQIFRNYNEKDSFYYSHVQITCTCLFNSTFFEVEGVFYHNDNQGDIFNSMLHRIQEVKMKKLLEKKKGEG